MYIEQIHNKGLSQVSYFIESGGEAAVIDPMRDVSVYLELAQSRNCTLKYIFETHIHSDFVSGHLDLAHATNANIVFGPGAVTAFRIYEGIDGEEFPLGKLRLKLLHTPGHTTESSCFLLLDESGNPHSIFTGDTLFVDEVGRPDVTDHSQESVRHMAGQLYHSLHAKMLNLPNYTVVYPGHGAGSVCGKLIGSEPHSTIGIQKQVNYALRATDEDEFVETLLDGLQKPPAYFSSCRELNSNGYENLELLLKNSLRPLTAEQLHLMQSENEILILDSRPSTDFAEGLIPGSIFIGKEGLFESTAAAVIKSSTRIVLITEPGNEAFTVKQLASIGLNNVSGYLKGGVKSWSDAGGRLESITLLDAASFESGFRYNTCQVIDVRSPHEWVPGFVAGSKLISLPELESKLIELELAKPIYVYCAEGYRSLVAASILRRNGFRNVASIAGGMKMIRNTTIQIRQLTSIAS